MRLFIAISFNGNTRAKLLALRDELRSHSIRGSFCFPENLHLTLVFLGECDAKQAAVIKTIMDTISFASLDLNIDRIGLFRRDGGDIWWAGVQESKPLIALQGELTNRLIEAGFTLDKRKYTPHITLAREVVTDAAPWQIEPFGETVMSVNLMKSERIGGKLTYTAIYTKKAQETGNV